MRTLEVQTPSGGWRKLGAWKRKQDVYNHIKEHDTLFVNERETYRIKTYAGDQIVAIRTVKAKDVRSERQGKRYTRPILTGPTGGRLRLDTRMAQSIAEQCWMYDGSFFDREHRGWVPLDVLAKRK